VFRRACGDAPACGNLAISEVKSVRRTILFVFLLAVCIGCTSNSSRGPLAPSGIGTGNTIVAQPGGGVNQITWACFTEPGECGLSQASIVSAPPEPIVGPVNVSAVVAGSTVTLNWQPPPGVQGLTGYVLEAGSAPGLSDIAVFILQSLATTITVTNVPSFTYYVRVRGIVNNCCATDPSSEIIVTVGAPPPACTPTVAPTTTRAPAAPSTITITVTSTCAWTAITNSPFLTITSGSSGVGNGVVTVAVAQNGGPNRAGTLTIAGQAVTINQDSGSLIASFILVDPASQPGSTTECRINSNPTRCELQSTSFTFGANAIVTYKWTVVDAAGNAKTPVESEPTRLFTFTEVCGGDLSSPTGAYQGLSVELTVTDNNGESATAVSGTGNQAALFLRRYVCP
jgi:hypothetical protein